MVELSGLERVTDNEFCPFAESVFSTNNKQLATAKIVEWTDKFRVWFENRMKIQVQKGDDRIDIV